MFADVDDDAIHGTMTAVILDPQRQGDTFLKSGPYVYSRRSLPGPGQEADAFLSYQWMSFSPIGPSYVNTRQLAFTRPNVIGTQSLGVQSAGVYQNQRQLTTAQLTDSAIPQYL